MMPRHELRDPRFVNNYMLWRRLASIERYVPGGIDGVIDIDSYEYCPHCYAPLALIETRTESGADFWPATKRLARNVGIPGYRLRYFLDEEPLPAAVAVGLERFADLRFVEVQNGRGVTKDFEPAEWANHLLLIHEAHERKSHK